MAEPAPPESLDYSNAIWRYARGIAMANMDNIKGAQAERIKLAAVKDSVQIRFWTVRITLPACCSISLMICCREK